MMDLAQQRRFFAEEIEALANLRTPALVDALATVPRERFLRPGPWIVRGESDFGGPARQTRDADPRRVYHNLAIAIDSERQLFNGAPSLLASCIDALVLGPGSRVLHIGAGLGYYTAIIGHAVGAGGRVGALEVDEALAAEARGNLAAFPWVDVRHGDGSAPPGGPFDAILVNAGVTHPLDIWLDALVPGGRMVMPLTATSPQMRTIGKGFILLLTRTGEAVFDVRMLGFVAIYSAVGLRDEALNATLGQKLMKGPFMPATRLRRDPHDPSPSCWLHGPTCCLSTG